MKAFAGIGSRVIPDEYAKKLLTISRLITQEYGYWLRTGAAIGADQACAIGACSSTILYLPWKNYEKEWVNARLKLCNVIGCETPSEAAIEMASKIHPAWNMCSRGARLMHGRNAHIILGRDLKSPVEFVIYYSAFIGHENIPGGTGLGVQIALANKIPLYNISNSMDVALLIDKFNFGKLL